MPHSSFIDFGHAFLRLPGPEMTQGQTMVDRGKPVFETALEQHKNYINVLESIGIKTRTLPSNAQFPDGCFVEDTHLVFPEVVVRLNPGHPTRNKEPPTLQAVVPVDRPLVVIPSDLTIDGGDCLHVDDKVFVGISKRTTVGAINALSEILSPHGYQVIGLPVPDGLHLKSGLTAVLPNVFVGLKGFDFPQFTSLGTFFTVPETEPLGANVISLNGTVMLPPGCPQTKAFIAQTCPELKLVEVDTSEFNKIDGALTCLSVRWH